MLVNTTRLASQLLNVRVLWPFLLATICVAIFGDMLEELLKQWIGPRVPHAVLTPVIIAALAALFFWLAVVLFKRQVQRLTGLQSTAEIREAAPRLHKGLILLVSRAEPCRQAIQFHQPILERVWLICSTRSRPEADLLQQEFPGLIPEDPVIINNVYQPSEVAHQVNEIYRRLPTGWRMDDVIADGTGMTVQSSIGLVLACWGQDRPLQYTPALLDEAGKIVGSGNPIELRLQESSWGERSTQ